MQRSPHPRSDTDLLATNTEQIMLKRRFEWTDKSDMGDGWVPAWMEGGDPVGAGFGAAHDVLEHFPRCIGGFEGEMMAFGAMHMVRSEYDFGRFTIYEGHASDLTYFLRNVIEGDQTLRDPGPFSLDGLYRMDPDATLECIRKGILGACKEMGGYPCSLSELASYRRALPIDADTRILGWMVKGLRKAEKRFAQWDMPGWRLTEMFNEIRDEWDRVAKSTGELGEYIDVRVNFAERDVRITREYAYN
jgi:hypothetical protein